MAFGKLFTKPLNTRSAGLLAVAKANGLEIEKIEVDPKKPTAEFLKYNKLAKVPVFVGADGYVLTECMAIAIYLTSQNEKTTLLGKTKQDYASILKWMSFFNTEVLPTLASWFRPLLGLEQYNKKHVEDASKTAEKVVSVLEEHLLHNTFLVGERITLADLFAVGIIARGFKYFYGKDWRAAHPNVSRWYLTIYNQAIYNEVADKFELLDAPALTNTPPKREEKKKEPKKEAAKPKAAKKDDEEEEEDKPAPKPKHPCDLLPRSAFPLDDWKRFYSNHDEAESMKWFWENVPFEDYSLWKVVYKYPEELGATFMSSNLIGGFNTRLEGSRKYLMGCASVYGKSNDSVIYGAFVIRGQEFLPVFDVAPDYESYEFTKLDPKNPEDKAYVESMWTWDKPVTVNGKEYPHAKGKVFK